MFNFVIEVLNKGGFVLWLLAGLSIITVSVIFYILLRFRKAKFSPEQMELIFPHYKQNSDLKGTSTFLTKLYHSINNSEQSISSHSSFSNNITQAAIELLDDMRSGFRILEVIAATAPLLGLLGTVIGMIKAFERLAVAGSQVDPSMLSAGIWQALLTTAGGLIVAIPALVAWHYFDRRVEQVRIKVNSFLLSAIENHEFENQPK